MQNLEKPAAAFRNPLSAAVRPDRHIGNIALVQHDLHPGVAHHLLLPIQGNQKAERSFSSSSASMFLDQGTEKQILSSSAT